MQPVWFTYIITNYTNTVFYIGYTKDLKRRLSEHKRGVGSHFPKRYRLYKLVWYQEFYTSLEAAHMESKLKGWTREKKRDLIMKINPKYSDLLTFR